MARLFHSVQENRTGDLAAARAAYLDSGKAPDWVRPVVLESWERSRGYGIDSRRLKTQTVDPDRLRRAQEENRALLAAAEPFLQLVHRTLADEPHVVALADARGFILRALAGPGLEPAELERSNLVAGTSWHERDIGCNGVGSCLAKGEPIVLIGPEHFQESYVGWTCIGAPIRDGAGRIVGALDLSVPNEHAHVHGWGWTLSLAFGIEASLLAGSPPGAAEASRVGAAGDDPLQAVEAVFDLLATKLGIPAEHGRFLDEARAELQEAEARREASIDKLRATIRERTRAEEALERERQFLARLIDSIPIMVTIYDPALEHVRLNRYVEEIIGWTNEDLEHADVMELYFPDSANRERVRSFMQTLEPGWRDFEITAKDGSVIPTSWANVQLTEDRRVGIGIDLTQRKEAERELQEAYERTRGALQDHDHVVAVVSHELRNPLNALAVASAFLEEDVPQEKKEAQVSVIRRSVNQMRRLVEDLLEAARIDGGGLRILPEPRRADELVRGAVDSMAPLAESHSVALTGDAQVTAQVVADRDRLLQVFTNLILNAIHHTPEGGSITVGAVEAGGEEVRFFVRDTGQGIAAEDLPHIFERYWQARKSSSAGVGAGLGLAIAKGVVEAHGGRIWAESEPGAGATFWFTVPVAAVRPTGLGAGSRYADDHATAPASPP